MKLVKGKDRLSDRLSYWRSQSPDEWVMDGFILESELMENRMKILEDAIDILPELSDMIADWRSECNCYSTKSMIEYEDKIDELLEKLNA